MVLGLHSKAILHLRCKYFCCGEKAKKNYALGEGKSDDNYIESFALLELYIRKKKGPWPFC